MNVSSVSIEAMPVVPTCCANTRKSSNMQRKVDTICRIALGVFAAVCAPAAFLVSFSLGIIAGSIYGIVRLYRKELMLPEGESKPVCAQGYMDFLSGMRFPPPIGTLATAAFIAAHTRHDPLFYSPFCGLFVGFWIGHQALSSKIIKLHAE